MNKKHRPISTLIKRPKSKKDKEVFSKEFADSVELRARCMSDLVMIQIALKNLSDKLTKL